ncbi:MAG: biliverdin-producing heme oxygenase [Wenzhouxiangella sp.]|jgi:heme oxygenase|nr:biliverdin-producing heme oxygenase [Wenzhouxiangella sp.]
MKRAGASFQLKVSTDELHRKLDSTSMLSELVLPSLTADRYALMLKHMAKAWNACLYLVSRESGSVAVNRTWIDPEWFALRDRLYEDLESLNASARPIWEEGGPRLELDDSDPVQMAGLAYVLNGSRLGAKMIYRKLLAHSDPVIRGATRHFAAAGVPGADWASFKKRLDDELCTPAAVNNACRAAALTFRLWLDVMTPRGVDALEQMVAHA